MNTRIKWLTSLLLSASVTVEVPAAEAPTALAIREVQEEIGVTPMEIEDRGVLHFQFIDGYSLHCAVLVAHDYAGEPVETAEAIPLWFDLDAIPFSEMWADDQHWLPDTLRGRCFDAWFVFEGDCMLSKDVRWRDGCDSKSVSA